MPLTVQENIICIKHQNPELGAGQKLANEMATAALHLSSRYSRIAIVHDATNLSAVTIDYAKAFAQSFRAMREIEVIVVHVAVITKAVNRMFAKVAANLAGIDLHIHANKDTALAQLEQQGFSANVCLCLMSSESQLFAGSTVLQPSL